MAAVAPQALRERLEAHGQEHLLRFWDDLDEDGRRVLAEEIEGIDLDLLDRLVRDLVHAEPDLTPTGDVRPIDVVRLGDGDVRRDARPLGEELLRAGEVAVVIVAGGQGTRLGFDGPKGTYGIAPVSRMSLFEIHARKVRALGRRYGVTVPLYVMTSPVNHADTEAFVREHDRFGLDHVRLFVQGQMPAVDRATGRVLLAEPGHVALSPDGHGGTVRALATEGPDGRSALDDMRERGITTLFYLQVDNALVEIGDPIYLGLHRRARADVSFKVVEKREPREKVGVVVEVDGRPDVIEYSDLPDELAERRRDDGGLELWAGSIALHVFAREFLERLGGDHDGGRLPFHRAVKKVPYVDQDGRPVDPDEPNAVKFETFIFDTLPLARRFAIVETDRAREFEPLKNASGGESPESVRRRLTEVFAGWLEQAGVSVPRGDDGAPRHPIEIDPLFALDADELREKVDRGLVIDGPLHLR